MKNIFQKIVLCAAGLCLSFFLFIPAQVSAAGCCKMYEKGATLLKVVKGATCVAGAAVGGGVLSPVTAGAACVVGGKVAKEVLTRYTPQKCADSSTENECSEKIQQTGQDLIGIFDDVACNQVDCKSYAVTSIVQIPEVQITNPICWPENECIAVCQGPDECFSGQAPECVEGRGYCFTDATAVDLSVPIGSIASVRDIGSYIALIYNYLIGVVTIVAIVMIMYGGFRWVTAAGNPERIGGAKQTIIAAVIGLVLALFSYTILSVINPALLHLSMPLIKRVRPIYFEILPARCQDYRTEADCVKNEYNFNSKYDGCDWTNFGGWGEQCTIAERAEGQPGNVCAGSGVCSGTQCVEVFYKLGPHASEYNSAQKWCTDGTMDMPCKYDTDCNKGLYCDENNKACVGIKGGRPTGSDCDNDGECSSGFCDAGQCGWGKEKQICKEDDDCSEGQGYKCVEFSDEFSYCCPSAAADGDSCYTGCRTDAECGGSMYCWKSGMNASFRSDTGDTKPRRVREWEGRCYKYTNVCVNIDGKDCESGSCGAMEYADLEDLPSSAEKYLLMRSSDIIAYPIEGKAKYNELGMGTCQ